MNRLFAFGCSYTNYRWPMWPWMLVNNYDQVFNYGNSGAGNDYIFLSVIDAIKCHKINENDTIIILWSSYFRHDFLREDNAWILRGNAFDTYDKDELDKIWSLRYSVTKLASYINFLTDLFQSKNIKFLFGSLTNIKNVPSDNNENSSSLDIDIFRYVPEYLQFDVKQKYFIQKDFTTYQRSVLENTHDDHYFVKFTQNNEALWDPHPILPESLEYVKTYICPLLDIELKINEGLIFQIHKFIKEKKLTENLNFSNILNEISWHLGSPIPLDKFSIPKYFQGIINYSRQLHHE